MSEAHAAAARIKDGFNYAQCPDHWQECNDARAIAEWALPLLDETPADEAFMLSAGFDDVDGCMMVRHGENVVSYLKSVAQFFVEGRGVDGIKTRGQLRMLCRSLGIELKEPTN